MKIIEAFSEDEPKYDYVSDILGDEASYDDFIDIEDEYFTEKEKYLLDIVSKYFKSKKFKFTKHGKYEYKFSGEDEETGEDIIIYAEYESDNDAIKLSAYDEQSGIDWLEYNLGSARIAKVDIEDYNEEYFVSLTVQEEKAFCKKFKAKYKNKIADIISNM